MVSGEASLGYLDSRVAQETLRDGRAYLGIELGSTRVKACLVGPNPSVVLGTGSYAWENEFVEGLWTYSMESVWQAVAGAYADLQEDLQSRHGASIRRLGGLGISGMMHGYLPIGDDGALLAPFRTWRNTNTRLAAERLSEALGINIPLRWSIAHLYQAVLDREAHVPHLRWITTLSGYVHWRLSGRRVLGIGDASGMFPVDPFTHDFDNGVVDHVDRLLMDEGMARAVKDLLPQVLVAGERAGSLTIDGALLLDPTGGLEAGVSMCPPEGDAGTGMVATNSVAPRTANVSAGTSIFAMVVLERPLGHPHPELDVVSTPAGNPVAMVHSNNGGDELAAWVRLFVRFAEATGSTVSMDDAFSTLLMECLKGENDAGGIVVYNHLAGEPIVGLQEGRPLVVRGPSSLLTLGNFVRAQVYGMFGTLSLGMEILQGEGVVIDVMHAHGGFFRTTGVAQRLLAGALNVPVITATSASEGGAWGIAVLAAYQATRSEQTLNSYLADEIFDGSQEVVVEPRDADVKGYGEFLLRYRAGLPVVAAAVNHL